MRQAALFSNLFANWQIDAPWKLDGAAAPDNNFFAHSYWGVSLMNCMSDWVSHSDWPPADSAQEHVDVGVA